MFILMGHACSLYGYFYSFKIIYRMETVDFSGIRSRNVGVEDENADHLTTSTFQHSETKSVDCHLLHCKSTLQWH